MRAIILLALVPALVAAGPSDFLRYETKRNGHRVTIRTHSHAITAAGFRPVCPEWADVPKILGLSPPTANGKARYRLALHEAGELKVKGECTVQGDEATWNYKFSARGGISTDVTVTYEAS